jgi:hypothetical protein
VAPPALILRLAAVVDRVTCGTIALLFSDFFKASFGHDANTPQMRSSAQYDGKLSGACTSCMLWLVGCLQLADDFCGLCPLLL